MQSPQQVREARFRHLLEPLRDLADNWNINIATELEDYLEELETIQISLDGGKTNLNFAEAALVIQGSADIYSKKVEFLHSLVFHTLDLVTAQKHTHTSKKSGAATGEDADIQLQEEAFLELDDVLQEGTNIDLIEDDDDTMEGRGGIRWHRRKVENPRDRLAALRLEQALGDDNFRITSSAVTKDGTLLLDTGNPGLLSLSPIHPLTSPAPQQFATPGLLPSAVPDFAYNDDGVSAGGSPIHFDPFDDASVGHRAAGVKPERQARMMAPGAYSVRHTNPWAQLDPHTVDETATKPFSRMRAPHAISNAIEVASHGVKSIPTAAAGVSSLASEFSYLAKREQSRQAKKRLELIKTRQSRGLPTAGIVYGDEDDGLGDDDFGDSYGGDDDGGFGHVDADAFAAVSSQEAGEAGDKHPTARLSLEAAFQAGNTSVSYEDLCKKHIEAFMRGAENYAVETQLTRRVAEWTERMEPMLKQEETRPEFNIYSYGDTIIHKLEDFADAPPPHKAKRGDGQAPKSSPQSVCAFRELTDEYEPYDVCRTFLACLQLANDGNVEIISESTDASGQGTFSVKLLSSQRRALAL